MKYRNAETLKNDTAPLDAITWNGLCAVDGCPDDVNTEIWQGRLWDGRRVWTPARVVREWPEVVPVVTLIVRN